MWCIINPSTSPCVEIRYTGLQLVMLLGAAPRPSLCPPDLSRQLTEFEAQGVEQHPSGLHWVGSDAVLLTWEDGTALLVGPYGDHVELTLGDDVTVRTACY